MKLSAAILVAFLACPAAAQTVSPWSPIVPLCTEQDLSDIAKGTPTGSIVCPIPQGLARDEWVGFICPPSGNGCRLPRWQIWCKADGKMWSPRADGTCYMKDAP